MKLSKLYKAFTSFFISFFSNRRRNPRLKIGLPLYFKVLFSSGKESDKIRATIADISTEGLCFLIKSLRISGEHLWFNDSISTRNILQLHFSLPDISNPIEIRGEICYFTRLDDYDKNFKIGVTFIDEEAEEKENIEIIRNFILNYKTRG